MHIPALIPADYLPDVHARLIMYKRIAGVEQEAALWDLQEECIDRFGLLPDAAKNLFRLAGIKQRTQPLGIRKIDLGEKGGRIYFHENADIDMTKLISLLQTNPHLYKLEGGRKTKDKQRVPQCTGPLPIPRRSARQPGFIVSRNIWDIWGQCKNTVNLVGGTGSSLSIFTLTPNITPNIPKPAANHSRPGKIRFNTIANRIAGTSPVSVMMRICSGRRSRNPCCSGRPIPTARARPAINILRWL